MISKNNRMPVESTGPVSRLETASISDRVYNENKETL